MKFIQKIKNKYLVKADKIDLINYPGNAEAVAKDFVFNTKNYEEKFPLLTLLHDGYYKDIKYFFEDDDFRESLGLRDSRTFSVLPDTIKDFVNDLKSEIVNAIEYVKKNPHPYDEGLKEYDRTAKELLEDLNSLLEWAGKYYRG